MRQELARRQSTKQCARPLQGHPGLLDNVGQEPGESFALVDEGNVRAKTETLPGTKMEGASEQVAKPMEDAKPVKTIMKIKALEENAEPILQEQQAQHRGHEGLTKKAELMKEAKSMEEPALAETSKGKMETEVLAAIPTKVLDDEAIEGRSTPSPTSSMRTRCRRGMT